MALFVLPLGFWWQWFTNVWPAAEFEAKLCAFQARAADLIILLRRIERFVAMAAS